MSKNRAKELEAMLLNIFEYKDVAVRVYSEIPAYTFEIRIRDMIFVGESWATIQINYKINDHDLDFPGAIVGQLSYLLNKEKEKVAA